MTTLKQAVSAVFDELEFTRELVKKLQSELLKK